MYIAEVVHKHTKITSIFVTQLRDAQEFAMDWSRNKSFYMKSKIPFGDLTINVYDVRKPCAHDEKEIPMVFF